MTERTPLADDDVIDLLRQVTHRPAPLDVDALVARARRSLARRRIAAFGTVTGAVVAAVVAVGLAVAPGLVRTSTTPAGTPTAPTRAGTPTQPVTGTAVARPYVPPQVSVGPATPPAGGASSRPPATVHGAPHPAVASPPLLATFGDGWQADPRTSGFAGDIRVVAGSAAAAGLPRGYDAVVRLMTLPAAALPLDQACRAGSEKGLVTSACTPVITRDGTTVQRQDGDAVVVDRWAYSSIRLILQRPDGSVRLADLIAFHEGGVPATADRARAAAWLTDELTHLETAIATIPTSPVS